MSLSQVIRLDIIRNFALLAAIGLLFVATTQTYSAVVMVLAGCLHGLLSSPNLVPRRYRFLFVAPVVTVIGGIAFTTDWVLLVWLCLLTGHATGMAVGASARVMLLAQLFLQLLTLTLLFFFVLPEFLGISSTLPQASMLIATTSFFVCFVICYFAATLTASEARAEPAVTFLTTLLVLILALLTGLLTLLELQAYLVVMLAVLVGGLVLTLVAWVLWSPLLGEGLANLFFRHIMDLSIPLEQWLAKLSLCANESANAQDFWQQAMTELIAATAIDGVGWEENGHEKKVGSDSQHFSQLALANMHLTIFSQRRLLPTARLNLWLLARMALEYRQAKEREATQAAEARMRSIHELGARTTHDLKNLLQAITLLAERGKESSFDKRREQLLLLASRLETTLARLKGEHADNIDGNFVPAQIWWDNVKKRSQQEHVAFVALAEKFAFSVPAELFDRALENLLHNALRKQGKEGQLDIEVHFGPGAKLTVTDNGDVIPAEIAERLFQAPLPSSEGMGIGLYQLALSAKRLGYELYVSANTKGDVAVTLEATP